MMTSYYEKHGSELHKLANEIRNKVPIDYMANFSNSQMEVYRRDSINKDSIILIYKIESQGNKVEQIGTTKIDLHLVQSANTILSSLKAKAITGITPENAIIIDVYSTDNGGSYEFYLFNSEMSKVTKDFISSECSFARINDSSYIHYSYGFIGNRCIK